MKLNIINYELGVNDGILSKFTNKISENLILLKVENSIKQYPVNNVDINHHINYCSEYCIMIL